MRLVIGRRLLVVLIVGMMPLSGCLAWTSSDNSESVEAIEDIPLPAFPEFNLKDHQNQSWSSDELQPPYVAYFSASWCTHCKPTLGALDAVIPNGSLLVFNKDGRDGNGDMVKWHTDMENELNLSISHPFIHAPDLASNLEILGIPVVVFVSSDGIEERWEGLHDDVDEIRTVWEGLGGLSVDID